MDYDDGSTGGHAAGPNDAVIASQVEQILVSLPRRCRPCNRPKWKCSVDIGTRLRISDGRAASTPRRFSL